MPISSENLVFVVCSPRSGSTLLSRILNGHSELAAPFEIGVPKFFVGDDREMDVINKTIRACRYYGLDVKKAVEDVDYYLDGILAAEKKKKLVVKDPRHAIVLPKIYAYCGDVKLIVLSRDVRAVCQSSMFKTRPENGMRVWLRYYQQVERYADLFSSVHHVRYEDLTIDPERHVQNLCDFIGVGYEPAMLDYASTEHTDDKMKLWGKGLSPKNSEQQVRLATAGRIEANAPTEFPDTINRMYAQAPALRAMNEKFGYR